MCGTAHLSDGLRTMSDSLELLRHVVKAWESLPEGNYSPRMIEMWLRSEMKPAIDEIRQYLKESDGL